MTIFDDADTLQISKKHNDVRNLSSNQLETYAIFYARSFHIKIKKIIDSNNSVWNFVGGGVISVFMMVLLMSILIITLIKEILKFLYKNIKNILASILKSVSNLINPKEYYQALLNTDIGFRLVGGPQRKERLEMKEALLPFNTMLINNSGVNDLTIIPYTNIDAEDIGEYMEHYDITKGNAIRKIDLFSPVSANLIRNEKMKREYLEKIKIARINGKLVYSVPTLNGEGSDTRSSLLLRSIINNSNSHNIKDQVINYINYINESVIKRNKKES